MKTIIPILLLLLAGCGPGTAPPEASAPDLAPIAKSEMTSLATAFNFAPMQDNEYSAVWSDEREELSYGVGSVTLYGNTAVIDRRLKGDAQGIEANVRHEVFHILSGISDESTAQFNGQTISEYVPNWNAAATPQKGAK